MKQIFWIVIIICILVSLVQGRINRQKYEQYEKTQEAKYEALIKDLPELSYSYIDNLKEKRDYPTVIELDNKNLVFIGGGSTSGPDTIEIYDAKTKKTHLVEEKSPIYILKHQAFKLSNGNIIIFSKAGIVEFNVKSEKFIVKKEFRKIESYSERLGWNDNISDQLFIVSLDNNKFLLFKKFANCKEDKNYLKSDYLYSYANNDLKLLRQFKFPISSISCWESFPYDIDAKKTSDGNVLIVNYPYTEQQDGYNRLFKGFVEKFDTKTLKFSPVDYYNYNIKFSKSILFKKDRTAYNFEKDTYISYNDIFKNLPSETSKLTFNETYFLLGNDIIGFAPAMNIVLKDSSKSHGFVIVYKYNLTDQKLTAIGYLPFHEFSFTPFVLNEHDILLSGGSTVDGSIDENLINLEHNNVILHLK